MPENMVSIDEGIAMKRFKRANELCCMRFTCKNIHDKELCDPLDAEGSDYYVRCDNYKRYEDER